MVTWIVATMHISIRPGFNSRPVQLVFVFCGWLQLGGLTTETHFFEDNVRPLLEAELRKHLAYECNNQGNIRLEMSLAAHIFGGYNFSVR